MTKIYMDPSQCTLGLDDVGRKPPTTKVVLSEEISPVGYVVANQSSPVHDRLTAMWDEQASFVDVLIEKRGFPQWPVDIKQKHAQQLLKGLGHDCMHELFEALTHLRNGKAHRNTEVTSFDRDAFLEECVDAHKLFLEVLIYAGVTVDEFYEAYVKKSAIVRKRIEEGY